jgi:hypothetical protein
VPAYVLCVQFRLLSFSGESDLERLSAALSEEHSCLAVAGLRARRRLRKVDEALIFER